MEEWGDSAQAASKSPGLCPVALHPGAEQGEKALSESASPHTPYAGSGIAGRTASSLRSVAAAHPISSRARCTIRRALMP